MMNQLTVKNVEFYGDETASVTLENENLSVEVFCHLCKYSEGDKVNNLLRVLDADVRAAYLSDWPAEMIEEVSRALHLRHIWTLRYGQGNICLHLQFEDVYFFIFISTSTLTINN
ncbi:hypothetical protein RS130_06590 [Paraglaciecola aquimarina]|uniref:Uncharacterized protein n=1 Tax=Paraglaciecola aquimarina TaxID=1235557 RepID=A0ABU3SUG2_9ALTE|nr:hypothetical protein [Paraglaciecola aquimarina]MDU0353642.1 hypothetical protein [Paraglaciecola aquimarina]